MKVFTDDHLSEARPINVDANQYPSESPVRQTWTPKLPLIPMLHVPRLETLALDLKASCSVKSQ